jgi:hypothetical protein
MMAEQLSDVLAALCIMALVGRTVNAANKAVSSTQAARRRSIRRAVESSPLAPREQKAQHGTHQN